MTKVSVSLLQKFTGHAGSIYGLYFSRQNKRVYTGAADGYVVEWDLEKPDEGKLISRLNEPVYSLFLHEESQQLWIGTGPGNIHVIDLVSQKELKNLAIHTLGVFDLKLNQGFIYAAGGDGCISKTDVVTFETVLVKKCSDKSARSLVFHPEKNFLAAGFSDYSIQFLSDTLAQFDGVKDAHANSVFSLAFTQDGKYLLSGGRDAMLKIWRFEPSLSLEKEIAAHNLHVQFISVQPEGNYFITGSMDKTIKVWDADTFELLKVVDKARNNAHANSVNKLSWIDETRFVSIGDDKVMMLWGLRREGGI
jgi:WD40 repeat protein